jgi:RNA polymerase sigma-70 factor (ECF subfamily)
MTVSGPDVAALVERWIAGDKAAAEALYCLYYERALAFSSKLVGRTIDADEVAHEALVHGLDGIRGGARPDKFTGWILGIVRHTAARREDERGPVVSGEHPRADPNAAPPSEVLMRQEMEVLLQRAMKQLPLDSRKILEMRFEKEMTREALSERLGISTEAIDKRIDKAIGRIRELMARHFTTVVLPKVVRARGPVTKEEIAQLRPSFRQVFTLRHVQGLTVADIARELLLPVETVHERLKFAYHQLGCGPDDDYGHLARPPV